MVNEPGIELPPDTDWRSWIERWDRMQDRYILCREQRFAVMVRAIADTQQTVSRVLDPGCGTGSLMLRVLKAFPKAHVYGIDFDSTLLALAEKRLASFSRRVHLVKTDLREESWPKLLPGAMDAAVSATALHWLSPRQLSRLYGRLAEILCAGGIFLNADHVRSDCRTIQEGWEHHRETMRRQSQHDEVDDWEGFWDAYGRVLGIDIKQFRRELTEPWEGSEEGLPLEWHFERLSASGFDAVYGGTRRQD
ncbi:MAG: class I SAM-dependent methyltransferase [Planctomycetota bacterium]